MVNTEMPKSVQRICNPLWQDVALLHAKRQLADAWFWDRDALEVLRWGAACWIRGYSILLFTHQCREQDPLPRFRRYVCR